MAGALFAPRHVRHLAFSFNFTDLPTGIQRKVMERAFRSVERFTVFSSVERQLYAQYFNLPIERFDLLHWGVRPPRVKGPPLEEGDYLCAIGGQARDYATLMRAMARLPHLRLVLVATPQSLMNVDIPANVSVHTNIPLAMAMNILAYSRYMVLPLRDNRVPCGHVTLVAAMHLGKAVIATGSAGLLDYITPGVSGLTCPAGDHAALARTIQSVHDDPEMAPRLGLAGQLFAHTHCVEERVVEYFQQFLMK